MASELQWNETAAPNLVLLAVGKALIATMDKGTWLELACPASDFLAVRLLRVRNHPGRNLARRRGRDGACRSRAAAGRAASGRTPHRPRHVPITLVTDNGGPFRSFRFEAFITGRPELRHVRTRVRTPGQDGVRERAFQSLKYERLYRQQIDDAIDLVREAEDLRLESNTVRPHEALAWNRPLDVHTGLANPTTPTFPEPKNLPGS